MPPRDLLVRWLGRVPYSRGLRLQAEAVTARRSQAPDTLMLLEHPPVVTLGRGSDPGHVLATTAELRRLGIEVHEAGRGGDVTYHGPGQLVGYLVLALPRDRRDAHRYLRDLEQALIRTVARFGIEAGREPGLTGVWVGRDKIAAIGVRLSTGWITSHGFALNVQTDLSGFSKIVPCGIRGRGVTSMGLLLPETPDLSEVAAAAAEEIAAVFDLVPADSPDPQERLARGGAARLSFPHGHGSEGDPPDPGNDR